MDPSNVGRSGSDRTRARSSKPKAVVSPSTREKKKAHTTHTGTDHMCALPKGFLNWHRKRKKKKKRRNALVCKHRTYNFSALSNLKCLANRFRYVSYLVARLHLWGKHTANNSKAGEKISLKLCDETGTGNRTETGGEKINEALFI